MAFLKIPSIRVESQALFHLKKVGLCKTDVLSFGLFVLPYLAMLYFFSEVDVYNNHFFDAGYSFVYNLFRCVFVFYFFWTMYSTGIFAVYTLDPHFSDRSTFAERIALGYFICAVLWQMLFLVLGYLSLYTRPVAVIVFSPFVFSSYLTAKTTRLYLADFLFASWKTHNIFFKMGAITFAASGTAILAILLLVKGLYPAGGHDYWQHYFYYLTAALKNHGIWPNNVWLHYFYMKGVGWYFLGMLITDPLAPSLITYCFVIAAAFALFATIAGCRAGTLWPWASIFVFVFLYIDNTPAHYIANTVDAWGEFEKPHEINATFLVAIVWISASILRDGADIRWPLVWGAALCCIGITYVEQPSGLLVGCYLLLQFLYAALLKRRRAATVFFTLGCVTASAFASVLVINYLTTGIPMDELLTQAWPVVDLSRVERLGWLYDVLLADFTHSYYAAGYGFSRNLVAFLVDIFRLELLAPFIFYKTGVILLTAVSATLLLIGRSGEAKCWSTAEALFVFVVTTFIFTIGVGQFQDISFFRYTSFTFPLLIGLAAVVWLACSSLVRNYVLRLGLEQLAPIMAASLTVFTFWSGNGKALANIVSNAGRFAGSGYSIADAYAHQEGWSGRMRFGAIYPGALGAWKIIGPDVRFWSLNIHAYCMAPQPAR